MHGKVLVLLNCWIGKLYILLINLKLHTNEYISIVQIYSNCNNTTTYEHFELLMNFYELDG